MAPTNKERKKRLILHLRSEWKEMKFELKGAARRLRSLAKPGIRAGMKAPRIVIGTSLGLGFTGMALALWKGKWRLSRRLATVMGALLNTWEELLLRQVAAEKLAQMSRNRIPAVPEDNSARAEEMRTDS